MSCFSLQNNILRHIIIFIRIDSPSDMTLHMASGTLLSFFLSFFLSCFLFFLQETELTIDISGMDSNIIDLYVIGTRF